MTLRVLVVDPDLRWREMMRECAAADRRVWALEADSAEAALLLADSAGPPAVLVCSLQLPGRDGLWLAEQLRAAHPAAAVVMTTAEHDLEQAVRSLQAGVVDYLVKPFSRERMAAALERALLAHGARAALEDVRQELARKHAQVTEALAQLELSASTSLDAMLSAREPNDPHVLERAHRIARIAINVALALGIREPDLTHIERAVLLRDTAHQPTPDELRTLAILSAVPLLTSAVSLALAAHERYDGTGVPHGLRGEEIPLGGRIIGVAAAYDELVSANGAALPPAAAVDALRGRGGFYDPDVLNALAVLQPSAVDPGALALGGEPAAS
jgi:response regulator RpfG family c-di-GMP phosphodiesterase